MSNIIVDFRLINRVSMHSPRAACIVSVGRVPCAGEQLMLGAEIFTIHQVLHYADTSVNEPSARVEVRH